MMCTKSVFSSLYGGDLDHSQGESDTPSLHPIPLGAFVPQFSCLLDVPPKPENQTMRLALRARQCPPPKLYSWIRPCRGGNRGATAMASAEGASS